MANVLDRTRLRMGAGKALESINSPDLPCRNSVRTILSELFLSFNGFEELYAYHYMSFMGWKVPYRIFLCCLDYPLKTFTGVHPFTRSVLKGFTSDNILPGYSAFQRYRDSVTNPMKICTRNYCRAVVWCHIMDQGITHRGQYMTQSRAFRQACHLREVEILYSSPCEVSKCCSPLQAGSSVWAAD